MAHSGRNFAVQLANDGSGGQQLRLQGFNTTGPEMGVDPSGRQYYGAVHDHFDFLSNGGAEAEQPGFLVSASLSELQGHSLTLQVVGAQKWVVDRNTILMPDNPMLASGIDARDIVLQALSANETIIINSVREPGDFADTASLDDVLLAALVTDGGLAGVDDIELTYDIGVQSTDTIYVIESVLKTSAPGIADSESFYTILSPDGSDMRERLHFPALLLETSLGTPVPEPASIGILALLPVLMRRRRS
ncbi:MAG: hypothetical protein AB8C95_13710 [Phycisphaeraceae bacterium]